MERLWAPWRLQYVQVSSEDKTDKCLFCSKFSETDDAKNYVIHRREHCFCLLNIYPYNNGHCMIAPVKHVADISDLLPHERAEMMELLVETQELLKQRLDPHGFNIGINAGTVAGAGIADHVHMHIVPRWNGDTNFMPVLSDTRVIPQSLDALYDLLVGESDGNTGAN